MSDLAGPNQAETMLRRVSPEGRARALREQRRRQQRTMRVVGRALIAAVLAAVALAAYDQAAGSLPVGLVGAAVAVVIVVLWAGLARAGRAPAKATLAQASLPNLPHATAQWLEGQCPALPAPAAQAAETIAAELGVLGPQIARLSAEGPAVDSVRRLLAVELPTLIERYHSVPAPMRSHGEDQSADAHLLNGLRIVQEEVGRMSRQLAGGDLDALAVQDRFLELKYQGEAMLAIEPPRQADR